jgi:hypothetical protein
MVEKYTSIYSVLDKIRRDIGEEAEYQWTNIKEWIAEVMQKVNTSTTMTLANTTVLVDNYRASIPCNLVRTIAVTHNDCRLVYGIRKNTGNESQLGQDANYWINKFYINTVTKYDEDGNLIESQIIDNRQDLQYLGESNVTTEYYTIDGDYYKFSFETGFAEIDYIGVYTDENGLPFIPDNTSLREAMFLYVLYKMLMRGYSHSIFKGIEGVTIVKQMYEKELQKAVNGITFPSADEMRSFIASYVKLIPNIYQGDYYNQNTESRTNERTSTRQSYTNIWRG